MAIVVDEEILAAIIIMNTTIKNTAAHTANSTLILLQEVEFLTHPTAEAEGWTEKTARKGSASTAENMATYEPNATVSNDVSKPKNISSN